MQQNSCRVGRFTSGDEWKKKMVAQWLAFCTQEVASLISMPMALFCGVCILAECLCGFYSGILAAYLSEDVHVSL